MRRLLPLALALCIISCSSNAAGPSTDSSQLVVGALLSLTGPGHTLGRASAAAVELAADDRNARLAAEGLPARVSLRIEDTKLDPTLALERLKALTTEGVRVFIGPQSSAEVSALKRYADSAGVVLISQGSTASSLSIPGDNVFRLVPDDSQEGKAIVSLMWGDGIRVVVPLWRDDVGNQGLHESVRARLEAQGGTMAGGAHYAPVTSDFSAQLQAVRAEVADAIAQKGAGAVAIYLAAFEESAAVLAAASQDPLLAQVRWYGGDGTVQSAGLVANPAAAGFAASVGFRAPTYGLDDELLRKHADLIDPIEARSGFPADAFALAAYDALHLATLAYAEVGLSSVAEYKTALARAADAYTGATGPTRLNPAGDRASGDYDFYQVCASPSGPTWKRVAAYRATTATIVPVQGC